MDAISVAWQGIDALPIDDGLAVEPLEPRGDAEVEEALGVPPGSIERVRRIPGRSYAAARRQGQPVGVVAFDPASASTIIFRASSIAAAHLLLDAVRAARRPDSPAVRLHIENDASLSAGIVSVGGRVVMRMLRMEGDLTALPNA